MNIQGTTVTGIVLLATEFRDFCVHATMLPPLTLIKCNGCYQYFLVRHVITLRIGELVIACHHEVRDNVIYLSRRDFPHNCICGEPLIHQVCSRTEEEVNNRRGGLHTIGDVLVRGLWGIQNESIIGVRVRDSESDTYKNEPIKPLLDREIGGGNKIKTSTARITTSNGNVFFICSFC